MTKLIFALFSLAFLIQASIANTSLSFNSPQIIKSEVKNKIANVFELNELSKRLTQKNIKAFLSPESSATLVQYIRWDQMRKNGDQRFLESRFNDSFDTIFHSKHEFSILIDGPPDDVGRAKEIFKTIFPELEKIVDERVLSINDSDPKKITNLSHFSISLFNRTIDIEPENKIFQDQIEIKTQSIENIFEALEVIRLAESLDLKISDQDLVKLKKVVEDFEIENLTENEKYHLEKEAKKLLSLTEDLEDTFKLLEKIKLLEKFKKLGSPYNQSSAAYLFDKVPLPKNLNLALPNNKTHKQNLIITHNHRSFENYESITKSHKKKFNLFISRQNHAFEHAVEGNGVYFMLGDSSTKEYGKYSVQYNTRNAIQGVDYAIFPYEQTNLEQVLVFQQENLERIEQKLESDVFFYINNLDGLKNLMIKNFGAFETIKRQIIRRRSFDQSFNQQFINKLLDLDIKYLELFSELFEKKDISLLLQMKNSERSLQFFNLLIGKNKFNYEELNLALPFLIKNLDYFEKTRATGSLLAEREFSLIFKNTKDEILKKELIIRKLIEINELKNFNPTKLSISEIEKAITQNGALEIVKLNWLLSSPDFIDQNYEWILDTINAHTENASKFGSKVYNDYMKLIKMNVLTNNKAGLYKNKTKEFLRNFYSAKDVFWVLVKSRLWDQDIAWLKENLIKNASENELKQIDIEVEKIIKSKYRASLKSCMDIASILITAR